MAYNYLKVFAAVETYLSEKPFLGISEIARQLKCSHPTIQKAVVGQAGLKFRDFRKRIILEKTKALLELGISKKKISSKLGYKWPSNFYRFLREEKAD